MIKYNQRDVSATDADHQNENNKNFKNNFKFKKINQIINLNVITTTRQRVIMINLMIFMTIRNRSKS